MCFTMLHIKTFFIAFVVIQTVVSEILKDNGTTEYRTEGSRVLSRRKRFLTFPEGSSLQLVFCVQTAAIIPIGDIFLYGNTASLAWTLPSDTMLFDYVKERERAQKRVDTNKIGYLDENGRVLAMVPYKRRPIVNPAFAKRSIDDDKLTFKEKLKKKIDRLKIHQNSQRDYFRHDHDKKSIELHRSSRLELFGKIEKLLTALGRDGRQCVLYKLCEAAQPSYQGTFMQEFFKTLFTLPKPSDPGNFDEEFHREYDEAHSNTNDCISKYPGCDNIDIKI